MMRLQTHPGIGLITALALVHTLEPVARFPTARKVVGDQELNSFYYRLLQRKERAKARVAVAGKMLTGSYIMLRDRID